MIGFDNLQFRNTDVEEDLNALRYIVHSNALTVIDPTDGEHKAVLMKLITEYKSY